MASKILAEFAVSISEFKRNPSAIVASNHGEPVVVLNHNAPDFYAIPAAAYELLMERLEDAELNAIADARKDQEIIEVKLSDL